MTSETAKRRLEDDDQDDDQRSWHLSDEEDNSDNKQTCTLDEEEVRVDDTVYESFDTKYNDTDDSNPVKLQDPEAHLDSWLTGIDKGDIEKAKRAHEKMMRVEREELELDVAINLLLRQFQQADDTATVSDLIRLTRGDLKAVGEITDSAAALIHNGIYEVYELTQGDLIDLYSALYQ